MLFYFQLTSFSAQIRERPQKEFVSSIFKRNDFPPTKCSSRVRFSAWDNFRISCFSAESSCRINSYGSQIWPDVMSEFFSRIKFAIAESKLTAEFSVPKSTGTRVSFRDSQKLLADSIKINILIGPYDIKRKIKY